MIRRSFYENVTRVTGLPENFCRKILIEKFGPTFEADHIAEYLAHLREVAADWHGQAALADWKQIQAHRIKIQWPEPNPCPVTRCLGVITYDPDFRWVCSIGGQRHYIASVLARASGLDIERFVENIAHIAKLRALEAVAERERYEEGLRLAQAQQKKAQEPHYLQAPGSFQIAHVAAVSSRPQ